MQDSPGAGIDEVAAALGAAFPTPPDGVDEQARRKFEMLNGLRSNASGIFRYLSRPPEGRTPA